MATLNAHAEDHSCCGKRIGKAIGRGELAEVDLWRCPACGCDWTPRMVENVKYWEPHPVIMVFR